MRCADRSHDDASQMNAVYRADHVGSLLRPRPLIDARAAWANGRLPTEDLRRLEDESIALVLALQRKIGLDVLSDGEFRRATWGNGFLDAVRGVVDDDDETSGIQHSRWKGGAADLATAAGKGIHKRIVDKVSIDEPFTASEVRYLKEHANGPFKITMPSPTMFLRLLAPGAESSPYASEDELLDDFIGIYQKEVDWLLENDVPYIQLDSLRYINLIVESQRADADMTQLKRALERTVSADNRVLGRAKRSGVTRAVHMCRGNNRSSWFGEGSYEAVAETLFATLDTDRFLLEYDDARSGGFEPLRFVPKGKVVVLGLITSKTGQLESMDHLRRRVDEASRYVPLEYLAISPQCGFASTHLGNLLTEDEERRKLELVVEAARKIWS